MYLPPMTKWAFVFLVMIPMVSSARVGETMNQIAARYGKPIEHRPAWAREAFSGEETWVYVKDELQIVVMYDQRVPFQFKAEKQSGSTSGLDAPSKLGGSKKLSDSSTSKKGLSDKFNGGEGAKPAEKGVPTRVEDIDPDKALSISETYSAKDKFSPETIKILLDSNKGDSEWGEGSASRGGTHYQTKDRSREATLTPADPANHMAEALTITLRKVSKAPTGF